MRTEIAVCGVSFFVLVGCSGGKYQLGVEPADGGNSGAGSSGETMKSSGGVGSGAAKATSGGVTATNGGVAANGGSAAATGGSAAATGGSAAATGGTGAGMTGMGGSPCFAERPLDEVGFAEHAVVYERLARFILGQPASALPDQPFTASRDWAGVIALDLLEATEVPFAATRALSHWYGRASEATPESLDWASRWSPLVSGPNWDFRQLLANNGEPGRAGILTDDEFLQREKNPSRRGTWMVVNLFCMEIPQAPAGIDFAIPSQPPGVTQRQYFEEQVSESPTCAGCHRLIDPPGYALEHFDENAVYRTVDNGAPVDSSGEFSTQRGSLFAFTSVVDLGAQLITSCEFAHCLAERTTQDALRSAGLLDRVASPEEIDHIANEFVKSEFSTKTLISEVAKTPALLR